MVRPNAPFRMVSIQMPLYSRIFGCCNSSRDIIAMSMALVLCATVSSSKPVTFSKCVFAMPSSAARSFIRATNASSLPPTFSASATAASLAEAMMTHLSISSTGILSPGSRYTCEPPIEAAYGLTDTLSSKARLPPSTASITRSKVITLVTEAGGSA